jgi:chemotaxis protein MotB
MKFKQRHEEHENHERWLVSYADFITLLFAFFVVMYATSSQNLEKEKKFEQSIRAEFKFPPGGVVTGSVVDLGPNQGPKMVEENPGSQQQASLVNNAELEEEMEKKLTATLSIDEKDKTVLGLRHEVMGMRMSLAAATFFHSGSAKIKKEGTQILNKIAKILKTSKYRLLVEGHTDDLPVVKGSEYESNWELSAARASQVVRYLIQVHGFPSKRLTAVAHADQRPLVPNTNEKNRAINRRIEIMFLTAPETPYDEF